MEYRVDKTILETINDIMSDDHVEQPDAKKMKLSTNDRNEIVFDTHNTDRHINLSSSYIESAPDASGTDMQPEKSPEQMNGNSATAHSESESQSILEKRYIDDDKTKLMPNSEPICRVVDPEVKNIHLTDQLDETKDSATKKSMLNMILPDSDSTSEAAVAISSAIVDANVSASTEDMHPNFLKGIAVGIQSPTSSIRFNATESNVSSKESEVSTYDMDTSQHSRSVASEMDVVATSETAESNDERVILKRKRAPRKVPKPRLPLENRVYFSKKELDSAASFLEDKEDLADCIPLNDCFLLGEMFWIFTVKQLEFALDEKSGNLMGSLDNVMFVKFSTRIKEMDRVQAAQVPAAVDSPESNVLKHEVESANENETRSNGTLPPGNTVIPVSSTLQVAPSTTSDENTNDKSFPIDTITNIKAQIDPDREQLIREKISYWRQEITSFKADKKRNSDLKNRFSLDGPIKLLFPQATQNFLKSIQLRTLWQFLGLRKSETGAICELMHIWRRECRLPTIPDIGLGRHFIYISSRIETVLKACPPIAEADRGWILDPISGITGAAHDFLIRDQKILSGEAFLNMKTKQLADILEMWRQDQGMEKLRGSGKVAMISAWKACVKEALEAEADHGKIVDLSSFVLLVQNEKASSATTAQLSKTTMIEGITKGSPNTDESLEQIFRSKTLLEKVIGEGAAALLRSGGVLTASELFTVDINSSTSLLYKTLIDTGIVSGVLAFNKAVQNWRQMMKNYFEKIPNGEDFLKGKLSPLLIGNVPDSTTPRASMSENDSVSQHRISTTMVDSKENVVTSRPRKTLSLHSSDEAFNVLSVTTQEFLASMNIRNSHDFLTARSSVLATNYVLWRHTKGKPELKGMGSIASISGWKAQVRKKAKDLGLMQLAEAEPSTKGSRLNLQTQRQLPVDLVIPDKVCVLPDKVVIDPITLNVHGAALETTNKEIFGVQHLDSDRQSVFELSRRQKLKAVENWQFYITYRGSSFHKATQKNEKQMNMTILLHNKKNGNRHVERRLCVLRDVPITLYSSNQSEEPGLVSTFSSLHSNGGLIDVGAHGAKPYQDQSLDLLQSIMEKFIAGYNSIMLEEYTETAMTAYNILVYKMQLDKFKYLLYVADSLERGQVLHLIFPSIGEVLMRDFEHISNYTIMHKIEECLQVLTVDDLRRLMDWLCEKVQVLSVVGTEHLLALYIQRRRQYWLGRRIFASLRCHKQLKDENMLNTLSFTDGNGNNDADWKNLTLQQKAECNNVLTTQIEDELKYALDLDNTCGSDVRQGWNVKAIDLFEKIIKSVAQIINTSTGDDLDWTSLLELVTSIQSLGDTFEVDNPDIADMEMETEKNVVLQPEQHNMLGSGQISCNEDDAVPRELVWQIVKSIFEVMQIDVVEKNKIDCLERGLSSVYSIIFYDHSFTQDPIYFDYPHKWSIVESTTLSTANYIPHTLSLFLGIVWPELRRNGWRIIAGSTSDEITFVPKALSRKQLGTIKQIRARQNAKLDLATRPFGFTYMPKSVKRLLISVMNASNEPPKESIIYNSNHKYTVADVLRNFQDWLYEKLDALNKPSNGDTKDIIGSVVVALAECFNSCASLMAHITNLEPLWSNEKVVNNPVDTYRCEYLVPFLVSILSVKCTSATNDSDASDELEAIAMDLLLYISKHCFEFFDKRFVPPHEEYVETNNNVLWFEKYIVSSACDEKQTTTASVVKDPEILIDDCQEIPNFSVTNRSPKVEPFEILLEEEKDLLTDFIRITLENTLPFIATSADTLRRNGRQEGRPGLACRHCFGKYGEGKYFFLSLESLATCYPVLEKHYNKCPDTPIEVREQINDARTSHTYQRKLKPYGSQQAVFLKLWNRMEKCKPEMSKATSLSQDDDEADRYNDDDDNDDDDDLVRDDTEVSLDDRIFTDHRAVLDYIQQSDSISAMKLSKSNRNDLYDAIQTYYSCIEYAGRIVGTTSMPKHFTTQWLLHKMNCGKEQDYTNNNYTAGGMG